MAINMAPPTPCKLGNEVMGKILFGMDFGLSLYYLDNVDRGMLNFMQD